MNRYDVYIKKLNKYIQKKWSTQKKKKNRKP